MIERFLVIPISDTKIYRSWANLYSHARSRGWTGLTKDHNDMWIAASASVAGFTVLTMDAAAFGPLRGTEWASVKLLDAKTGMEMEYSQ